MKRLLLLPVLALVVALLTGCPVEGYPDFNEDGAAFEISNPWVVDDPSTATPNDGWNQGRYWLEITDADYRLNGGSSVDMGLTGTKLTPAMSPGGLSDSVVFLCETGGSYAFDLDWRWRDGGPNGSVAFVKHFEITRTC